MKTNIPDVIIPKLVEGQFQNLEMAKTVAETVVEGWKSDRQEVAGGAVELRCPQCTFLWVAKLYEVNGRVEDVRCPGPGCGFVIKGSEVKCLTPTGDLDDMTVADLEGFKCWNCGSVRLFDTTEGTAPEDAYIEDGQKSISVG